MISSRQVRDAAVHVANSRPQSWVESSIFRATHFLHVLCTATRCAGAFVQLGSTSDISPLRSDVSSSPVSAFIWRNSIARDPGPPTSICISSGFRVRRGTRQPRFRMESRVLPGIQKTVIAAAIGLVAIVSTVEAKKEVVTASSAGASASTFIKPSEMVAQTSIGLEEDAWQTFLGSQEPAGSFWGGDSTQWELGIALQSEVAGWITALRFYKTAEETIGHIGHVWSADGTQLAEVTFSNETASGWQEQVLPDPVPV